MNTDITYAALLIVVGAVIALQIVATLFGWKCAILSIISPYARSYPRIVAHRGNAWFHDENTTMAVISAIEEGAEYVEIDVQITKDDVPVVHHDLTLNRIYGIDLNIAESTWADIHTQNVYHEACNVATLAEMLKLLAESNAHSNKPQVKMFIDVKRESFERGEYIDFYRKLRALYATIGPYSDQVVIISTCEIIADTANHDFNVGLVIDDMTHLKSTLDYYKPQYVFIDKNIIPPDYKFDPMFAWCAYEVTSIREALNLHARGCQLIETMNPYKFLRKFKKKTLATLKAVDTI